MLLFYFSQSMGTQEDDVGSKTSSYSWGHCLSSMSWLLQCLRTVRKNIWVCLLSMDYIRGKPKMSAIIIFFFLSQRSHTHQPYFVSVLFINVEVQNHSCVYDRNNKISGLLFEKLICICVFILIHTLTLHFNLFTEKGFCFQCKNILNY